MFKCNKKSKGKESYPSKDEFQQKYREVFGDIVDKYLINYENEEKSDDIEVMSHSEAFRMIIYVDAENDIDWIVENDKYATTDELKKRKTECLCRLDIAQRQPCPNLSEKNILNFKILLGTGYNAALHCDFTSADVAIRQAVSFVTERNKEQARFLILCAATLFVLIGIIVGFVVWLLTDNHIIQNAIYSSVMGAIGAYVSIWSRSSKMDNSGVSTKKLHCLEAFARTFCGAIFGFIAFLAIMSGLLFSSIYSEFSIYVIPLVGFVAGFNERFIPSVIERFSTQYTDTQKEELRKG